MDSIPKAIDLICVCGHAESFHGAVGPPIGDEWCEGQGLPKDVGMNKICHCYAFRPDNLSIIEREAMRKKLI